MPAESFEGVDAFEQALKFVATLNEPYRLWDNRIFDRPDALVIVTWGPLDSWMRASPRLAREQHREKLNAKPKRR